MFLFLIFAFSLGANCLAKERVIFDAYSQSTQRAIVIDSVVVTNLANNQSFTTTADTIDLDLLYTSVNPQEIITQPLVTLKSDNPFENYTEFKVSMPEASKVSIELFDLMGRQWTSSIMFLDNGEHSFQLNAQGLEPGVYFLSIRNNINRQTLKLIKLGAAGGSEPAINYLSSTAGTFKNTQQYGKNSIQTITSLYSFDCYAKSYYHQKITHDFALDTVPTANITFALLPVNKYNISSGHIGISGLNYKHGTYVHFRKSGYPETYDSTFQNIDYSLNYIIQNVEYPEAKYGSYDSPGYFRAGNGRFLYCLDYLENSLIVDFCGRIYTIDLKNGIYSSKSMIVRIIFNKNSNFIDSMKFTFYNYNHICCNNNTFTIENETTHLNLYNIPFSFDSNKNITANLKGKEIINYMDLKYNRSDNIGHGSSDTDIVEIIKYLVSVSDDAYINLNLQQ